MAQTYGQRPSVVLGIQHNAWVGYQLDTAVLTLGRWADGEFEKWRDEKTGKPRKSMATILQGQSQRYMDADQAMAMFGED
jgi:hypothetical protein